MPVAHGGKSPVMQHETHKAAQCAGAIRPSRMLQITALDDAFRLFVGRYTAGSVQDSMHDTARTIEYGSIAGLLSLMYSQLRA